MKRKLFSGFTLIEILVVIFIIGLLASMVLIALDRPALAAVSPDTYMQ